MKCRLERRAATTYDTVQGSLVSISIVRRRHLTQHGIQHAKARGLLAHAKLVPALRCC